MDENLANDDPYNEAGQRWDSDVYRIYRTQKVARALAVGLAPTGTERALEIGAGTGVVTMILAPKLAHVTALDPMPGMLGMLREKLARRPQTPVEIIVGRAPEHIPDATYDLVYSVLTMHHVPDVPAMLRGIAPHVKSGGRIAIADLDVEDGSFHYEREGVLHHGFERKEFGTWLEAAGFADPAFSTAFTVRRADDNDFESVYPIFLVIAKKP